MIAIYCCIDKRYSLVTCYMIFHLFSSSIYLNSNFLFVIMLVLIFIPYSVNNENKKYKDCTYIGVFITLLVIIIFQSISFKLILPYLVEFTSIFKKVFLFDIFTEISNLVHSGFIKEHDFITMILDGINYITSFRLIR